MSELKTTCPFCGVMPEVETAQGENKYLVICCNNECMSYFIETGYQDTKEKAIEEWEDKMNKLKKAFMEHFARMACKPIKSGIE